MTALIVTGGYDWKDIRGMVRSLRDTSIISTLILWILYGLILFIIALIIYLIVRKFRKRKTVIRP